MASITIEIWKGVVSVLCYPWQCFFCCNALEPTQSSDLDQLTALNNSRLIAHICFKPSSKYSWLISCTLKPLSTCFVANHLEEDEESQLRFSLFLQNCSWRSHQSQLNEHSKVFFPFLISSSGPFMDLLLDCFQRNCFETDGDGLTSLLPVMVEQDHLLKK